MQPSDMISTYRRLTDNSTCYRLLKVMKKYLVLLLVLIPATVCSLVFAYLVIRTFTYVSPKERMQRDFAKALGVKIEEYPSTKTFPSGYYSTILQPGMTIFEVHKVVNGYEIVLHCGSRAEIYYYFSPELDGAVRFELRYDDQGNYWGFEGEDPNSHTIQTFGCEPGLIK
jgi:hypothetical protein